MKQLFRLSRLVGIMLVLEMIASHIYAQDAIDPKVIKKNTRVSNISETDVMLADARPDKLFYQTGEKVNGAVTISNPTKEAKAVQVRAWLEQGLDNKAVIQTKDVAMTPNSSQVIVFTWEAKDIVMYGQSLNVELLTDGKVLATGGDCFSSASNVWRVGLAGSHPVAWTAEHVKDNAGIERSVDNFRDNYINTFEKFFWAPDDFANMTPDKPEWYSGQARYHENLERLKHMCDYGNKIGVLPTTYGKSIGSGTAARDFIRASPEMVWGYGGVMSFIPDTEELAKWDIVPEKPWQSTAWANYNMNDPAVVQHGINQIIASSKQFGWAGVRFDGHFQARTGKNRVGDKIVDFSADDADKQTAANQKTLKEQTLKVFPNYVFGYNFANCTLDQRFQSNLRESIELCRGGGHIMDEYAKQNDGSNHPYRKWADFSELMVKQTEQVRRLGGELFPMVAGGQVGMYQTIFTLSAGAHPNNNYIPRNLSRFATRYGELLWKEKTRYIWNPLGMVVITPGVMWENYVREQQIDKDHKRLVIHMINPPLQDTATETARLEKEINTRQQRWWQIKMDADKKKIKPDFTELDKLPPIQLEPAPQKNIPVRIVPEAFDGKWDATRVLLLSADDGSKTELKMDKSDPYFWETVVPSLKYWSILVIEMEKK
ncbi:MAG: hypothetical protein WCO98_07420 [bacterium]